MNIESEYNSYHAFGGDDFLEVRMPLGRWRGIEGYKVKKKMGEIGYTLYDSGMLDSGSSIVLAFRKKHGSGDLDEAITRAFKRVLNEIGDTPNGMDEYEEYGEPMCYGDVARLLSDNGWSIFNSNDVYDKDHRNGVRMNIEPDSKNSLPFEGLKQKLIELCDEYNSKEQLIPGMGQYEVSFSSGYYKYAPENKFISIVIWNLE